MYISVHELSIDHPFGPTYVDRLDDALARARSHSGGSRLERGDLVEVTGASGSGKCCPFRYLTPAVSSSSRQSISSKDISLRKK
jgi:RecA/RadA recombinase